jgi:hypothetical protein
MHRDIRRLHVDFYEKDFITELNNGFRPEARVRWNIADPAAALKEIEERERQQESGTDEL